MASRDKTTERFRSFEIRPLLRVARLAGVLIPLLAGSVRGEEDAADPYDALYDVVMTRYGKDGNSYAGNETSPAIFTDSKFPFGDKTYDEFRGALDAFGALPQAKIEAYSDVKRALLQRHLWKLFDVTIPYRWKDPRTGRLRVANQNHSDRRAAVRPKIASLIRRLALTREQILALPNTWAVTAKSGGFSQRHDPSDEFKPFFPVDLYAKESSWVCMGTDEIVPADLHVEKLDWRSAFYSFLRLPIGDDTFEYVEHRVQDKEKLPVGSQLALVEQAFLISDRGELVLSPLTVSISMRAYLYVRQFAGEARPATTQCVAEFVMQPRQLMIGNATMKALDPLEHRFEASEGFIAQDTRDPFETGRIPRRTRLHSCMRCHRASGKAEISTRDGAGSSRFFTSSPAAISKATSNEKQHHYTWKTLRELWQVDGGKTDAPSLKRAEKIQPSVDKQGN